MEVSREGRGSAWAAIIALCFCAFLLSARGFQPRKRKRSSRNSRPLKLNSGELSGRQRQIEERRIELRTQDDEVVESRSEG